MNYAEFKALLLAYSKRADDESLVAIIDNMVELASVRIGRDVDLMELERIASFDLDNNFIGLPKDYMKMRGVWVDRPHSKVTLEYMTPNQYEDAQATISGNHGAFYYTIMNGQIHVGPGINTINMNYIVKPKTLIEDQDTNYVLTSWPNLYLYGALIEVWTYLLDMEPLTIAKAQYNEEVKYCNRQAAIARASGGPIVMRGP